MSVATKVAEFIAGCPFLEEFEQMFPIVNVDLLGEDATAYSLELAPADPIVRRYTNDPADGIFSLFPGMVRRGKQQGHGGILRKIL